MESSLTISTPSFCLTNPWKSFCLHYYPFPLQICCLHSGRSSLLKVKQMPIFCCFHCLTIKPKLSTLVLYLTWPLRTFLASPSAPAFLLFLKHTLLFLCWALRHVVCSSYRDLSTGFHMAAASSSRFLFVSPPERSLLIKNSK